MSTSRTASGSEKGEGLQIMSQSLSSGKKFLILPGFSWKNPMGNGPAGKRGPRELVVVQESSPPSSAMIHPYEQEIQQRQQEACMN